MESFRFHLGSSSQVPRGQGRCFRIGIHEVAVLRSDDGTLFAVENRCPQGGALADGAMNAHKVTCPFHEHQFDLLTGQGVAAQENVRKFKVWEENDNILLLFVFPAIMAAQ